MGRFSKAVTALVLLLCVTATAQRANAQADPNQGPGGPILVITSTSTTFGKYYAEILRTEGLNEFSVSDIGPVTATTLAAYDVVILAGPMTLSGAQVTMFTNWVNGGGNLIAMRPDPQLDSLLGLTSTAGTLTDAFGLVDTSTPAGSGIVSRAMQIHGIARAYTLNGATRVATLYSDPATATSNPAVTVRNVGTSGGHAAAFAYDLATSVVYTRQGNPAWAAQERDGFSPIRSDDKFFGDATGDSRPDWVDLNNLVGVPQADEQQRLLANLILYMNLAKRPLPRFWYFPRGKKAVVVMTGDDHGNGGTVGRFQQQIAASPAGCSVANWECIRSTSYMYVQPDNVSNTQAASFAAQGFEVGLHVNTNCGDYTLASLDSFYSGQINDFKAAYPSIPTLFTQRHHCIAWSDWASGAKIQLKYGMRLDTNYYFWPPGWVQDRPGHFTGSAMAMRFADLDGTLINVYNAPTQMTDESGQTYPLTIDALLDAAVGAQGYYGVYTVNSHTDSATNPVSDAVVPSAIARGVPVVSSAQMLTWLDGRNSSSFSGINWNGSTLTFSVTQATGANGLQAMVPRNSAAGVLSSITGPGGANVAFTVDIIKGVQYAFFSAVSGTYTATYSADTTRPTITSTSPASGATGVAQSTTVTATFSEPMDPTTITTATVELRDAASAIVSATVNYNASNRTATLTPTSPLLASTAYSAKVTTGVKDLAGNALAADQTWSFTTAAGPACPCSAWNSSATPADPDVNDPNPVELGVKFRVDLNGFITGIRYFKGATNTGTHIGTLWSSAGQSLATATFVNETASGWQQVNFSSPVAVTANTVYVASYHTTTGNYAANNNFFGSSGVDNAPVHLLQDGVSGSNGVYAYSASSTFPINTYQSSNYWVDVVFTVGGGGPTPLSVTSTTPVNNAPGVALGTTVSATFNRAINAGTVNSSTFTLTGGGPSIAGTYSVASATATFTPSSPLAPSTTYTATLSTGIKDTNGVALGATYSWQFTTSTGGNPCGAAPNAIVAENCLPGNLPSEWDISGAGDTTIQGFATDISVNQGGTVSFKINTPANYRLDVYRMGYYGGNGARKIATVNGTGAQNQPACTTQSATGLIDCGNWSVSSSWTVPAGATSGIYFAKAVRTDNGGASHIFFIVRSDASQSEILFQTSDTTWQAYNQYGGNSLYVGSPAGRAYKVSYNRPFTTRGTSPEDWVFNAEYPMVRWLESNGYDVSYTTGIDTERRGNLISNHKMFMSVGHDEYWSGGQRNNVEAARTAGVHLAFLSGNEIFWKTRWENSIAQPTETYRTLVCYKETHANAKIDPTPTWTGTWRDPRFSPPADGGRPENALSGTIFTVNCCTSGIQMTVSAEAGKHRFWRGTSIASLAPGATATFGNTGILNYEWDEDLNNGFRPSGLMRLSASPANGVSYLQDYGSTYASGNAVHSLTLYRHSSGALVFSAGTVQYSWALDSNHDRGSFAVDNKVQQATVNLLADMGVQPKTLQGGLTTAVASSDSTAPASTITSPTNGSTVPVGSPMTISGTAVDTGGIVTSVEVSVDGGTTWRSANGSASWSFSWTPAAAGSVTIRSRAVDDTGNFETPGAGVTVTVGTGGGGGGCTSNCTIWPGTTVPTRIDEGADPPVQLGVRFRSDVAGTITGIRFYKANTNTGTHVGTLWSAAGQALASATFNNETASGWQQVNFTSPVSITANTVYVASYHTTVGHYSQDSNYFATTGVDNAPLHALQNGVSGANGVYAYGAPTAFPNQTFNASNYWVDVVFSSGPAPTLNSIAVAPTNPTIQVGGTQQFTATGTYSDNSTQNITNQVTWASATTTVATINASGLASGVAAGTSTISATQGTVTGTTILTVQAAAPPALSVTTTALPGGTVGVAYSANLTAINGTAPYTWSVTVGSLPAGLSLNAGTGAITGTPTARGASTFTVQVEDAATPKATATKSLTITIVTNTGFLAPTAQAPVLLNGDGNGFETNPMNAFATDGLFAVDTGSGTNTNTGCANTGKDKHLYYNYSFNVPTGAAIRGVEVRLDAMVNNTANAPRMCVQLSWNGGTSWTAAQMTPTLTTTSATYPLGGASDLWGRTSWTLTQLSNTNFRVRISNVASSTARTFSLDGVAVRLTYQ